MACEAPTLICPPHVHAGQQAQSVLRGEPAASFQALSPCGRSFWPWETSQGGAVC